jgi:hypothetical protein
MIPDSATRLPVGFEAAPVWSRSRVTGKRYRSRAEYGVALVHGADGVSITGPGGTTTVLFDECTAVLRFDDGARHLVGADGIRVPVEPGIFPIPPTALTAIDSAVPAAAMVDMPPRDPRSVPKPAPIKKLGTLLVTPVGGTVVLSVVLSAFVTVSATAIAAADEPGFCFVLVVAVAIVLAVCAALIRR